ncbi:paeninodin family lasso peptide [Mesobacillus foraminis]|uniref:Paeninodin family lasso peptide n=1 Tax=Mesobacillus foraminis TaxID=279826 RepID=A0A4R2B6G9_9BACI|nr:paeninodin family lasso peptide [Mesobacillus foraminis]TCN22176.1 hypothetical protein EV146_11112 [Mesobacillus foraminis]
MKKEWQTPELVVLDVNNTMLTTKGQKLDNDFPSGTDLGDLTLS